MKSRFSLSVTLTNRSEQGMVLIVGLVMVLLLSIIALTAIRGSGLQETMAGNMKERNVAFQAAESALRDCEERNLGPKADSPIATCLDGGTGVCNDLDNTPSNSVINNDVYWKAKARVIQVAIPYIPTQPKCLVEILVNTDPKGSAAAIGGAVGRLGMQKTGSPTPYRVSAQGVGFTEAAPVVTQSTYTRLF